MGVTFEADCVGTGGVAGMAAGEGPGVRAGGVVGVAGGKGVGVGAWDEAGVAAGERAVVGPGIEEGAAEDEGDVVGAGVANPPVSSIIATKSLPPNFVAAYAPHVLPAMMILPSELADISCMKSFASKSATAEPSCENRTPKGARDVDMYSTCVLWRWLYKPRVVAYAKRF